MCLTKLRCQLLLMLGESGDSMPVSVCNSRTCALVLNALCVCSIATIGNATLACTRVGEFSFAHDSVVLTKMGSTGLDRMHFNHTHHLVGRTAALVRMQVLLRRTGIYRYADTVPTAGISNGLSVCLGCPVFKRDLKDDRTGNLWPTERLTPCKQAWGPPLLSPKQSSLSSAVLSLSCIKFLKSVEQPHSHFVIGCAR